MAKRSVPLRPHVQDALTVWGQLIRRGRLAHSWTAKDLAGRANVSEQTVLSAPVFAKVKIGRLFTQAMALGGALSERDELFGVVA